MSSSSPRGPRQVPPPAGARAPAGNYARFIPREELQQFSAWNPGSLSGEEEFGAQARGGGKPAAAAEPAEPPPPTPAEIEAQLQAARSAGYEDGYRDGLAALESFKRSFAAQVSLQTKAMVEQIASEYERLDAEMAEAVTRTALQLARQVVRSELDVRPQLVAQVAAEAVQALVLAARHVRVRVHPEDQTIVALGAAEALEMRGAQVLADPAVARGGCIVESDLGVVDAQLASRWKQAADVFGRDVAWNGDAADGR